MTANFRFNPCACGCGQIAQGRFCRGHNNALKFRPVGMSDERALEIALQVFDADPVLQARWSGRMREVA